MLATVLLSLLVTVHAGSLRYDQTQTGDTNIHLQIKNVEVLALLDDSAGAEYDYDYSDFTEKPPKPGPPSNVTFPTSPPAAAPNNTAPNNTAPGSTAAPGSSDTSASTASTDAAPTPEQPLVSSTEPPATTKKTRRCGAGFYRDTLGRCRRIRRPHLQMLMKLMKAKTTERPESS